MVMCFASPSTVLPVVVRAGGRNGKRRKKKREKKSGGFVAVPGSKLGSAKRVLRASFGCLSSSPPPSSFSSAYYGRRGKNSLGTARA